RWADPLVDFGRELYVPWQLVRGRVLYADVAYLNGPLSPYLNALWFRLFGISMRTLVLCNAGILGIVIVLLHRLLEPVSDASSAPSSAARSCRRYWRSRSCRARCPRPSRSAELSDRGLG